MKIITKLLIDVEWTKKNEIESTLASMDLPIHEILNAGGSKCSLTLWSDDSRQEKDAVSRIRRTFPNVNIQTSQYFSE